MNYRVASILPSEAANTATTKPIDLNFADPISRITVQFKGLNNGNAATGHPAKMLPKIEVVDGSDVMFSLSGLEGQALNYYDKGYMPHNVLNYIDEVKAIATVDLDFGRYLWDPVYALDPKKFTNPQLKITHNLALGGSIPDAGELSVFGHIFDQKTVTPTGFLMSKEQYSYTLEAGAKEHVDLATDYPYRKILLQSLSDTLQPFEQYNKIKLSEDNDRKVVINDERVSDLLKLLRMHPRFHEMIMAYIGVETEVYYCTVSYEKIATVTGVAAVGTAYVNDTYGPSVSVTDGTGSGIILIDVNGTCPHNTLCLPFGLQDDPEDWYMMDALGSLKLTLTAGGSASGSCEIISQQLRSY